jgi:hypothetical protein
MAVHPVHSGMAYMYSLVCPLELSFDPDLLHAINSAAWLLRYVRAYAKQRAAKSRIDASVAHATPHHRPHFCAWTLGEGTEGRCVVHGEGT